MSNLGVYYQSSVLFCCSCSISSVSFQTVKQRPGPVLAHCEQTNWCKFKAHAHSLHTWLEKSTKFASFLHACKNRRILWASELWELTNTVLGAGVGPPGTGAGVLDWYDGTLNEGALGSRAMLCCRSLSIKHRESMSQSQSFSKKNNLDDLLV